MISWRTCNRRGVVDMADRYVLTLDLGSIGLRANAVAFERPWDVAAGAEIKHRVVQSRDPGTLWRRFEPPDLRLRIHSVLAQGLAVAGIEPSQVASVSIAAQRGGTAFLDREGRPIYLGPNRDLRAAFEGAEIDDELRGQVYSTTGHLPSMFFIPAKLRWWRQHHPRTAARINRVATLGAWAALQLTGVLAETPAELGEAGLLDVNDGSIPAKLLDQLGISPELIPPLIGVGQPIGGVTADAASATGLLAGTPVYLAGPDAQTAALGSGATALGDMSIAAGWSAPVQVTTGRPNLDPASRTWVGLNAIPGLWVAEANPGDTGGTLDTVRRMLGGRITIERFDALAAAALEATRSVVAMWGPRALDLSNPGMAMGGLLSPTPITFDGLDPGTIARATLENIAYAIRECVEVLASSPVASARAEDGSAGAIMLTGGMSRSNVFAAMLADVLGKPVRVNGPRAVASGAGIMASRPPEQWPEAAQELASRGTVIEPHPVGAFEYDALYKRWLRLRSRLDDMADEM